MTTICVIQARVGSRRLPGKVLADLGGYRVLELLLMRLRPAPVDALVVATTVDPKDDPVAALATSLGVNVVRGPEHDVLGRFALALDAHPAETVVRLTADCPLMDPAVVGTVLADHAGAGADYTSNTLIRSYPDGLDVEVLSAAALRTAAREAIDPAEREHVTPFIYRRPERFVLHASIGPRQLAEERWTLDTPEDLAWLRMVVGRLSRPDEPWERIADLVPGSARRPSLLRPACAGDASWLDWPYDDPGRRVFVLDDPHGRLWGAVAVEQGRGWLELGGQAAGQHGRQFLPLLIGALGQDLQVTELRVDAAAAAVAGLGPKDLAAASFLNDGEPGVFVWTREGSQASKALATTTDTMSTEPAVGSPAAESNSFPAQTD
jgi:spore coat polysaccharide biosynthesis protein SpsF